MKPIQVLPTESNSLHRILENYGYLHIAEIGDDHNYIISGSNSTRDHLGNLSYYPADLFLRKSLAFGAFRILLGFQPP